ncbi:MAG TPA: sugar ABC transporter permease [Gammaproteobacteria bacterium]|nr:sugar ABC transporter permease [Gammaproteobacteria bacterium]
MTEGTQQAGEALPKARAADRWWRRVLMGWMDDSHGTWGSTVAFLLPALVIFALFTAYPTIKTIWNSFFIIHPNGTNQYIGFSNYIQILTSDVVFRHAVINTFIWATMSPIFDVCVGFILALFIYSKIPLSRFFRVVWFTPVLISYVVIAVLWRWIFNDDWGALNTLLRAVGLGFLATPWLALPKTALWALIFVDSWKWIGFHMIVFLAALHALPSEVLEAAELDNCGWWHKIWSVIVPMTRNTFAALLILSFIGKMKIFDLVWVMTRGGPLWSTETVSTYVYKRAFDWSTFDLGYPSAIATIWFFVVLVLVLLLTYLFRRREQLEY